MRNLKRALSLTLASVMLLGMMVVGSSAAAGYDDVKETDNVEAIEVLQAIEVMVGDERGFGPERPVNRAEMAVVMGKLLSLDYNYYASSCPFNDVYDWARGWVGAAYANKILSGRGDGVYDPGATVTAVEAASMLMRALGYFQYANDTADGFELSTVRQGTKIGIFNGVGSSATVPMTRNQVAQMVLNALQCDTVEPDGNTINLTTPDGTVLTGKVNYVSVTREEAWATAIDDTRASSVGSDNTGYIVELGERLYNGKLKLFNAVDDFGRPSRYWEFDGKEIGTYAKKELLRESYSVEVTGKTLYDLIGKAVIDDPAYDFNIYVDGVSTDATNAATILGTARFTRSDLARNNQAGVGGTGKGVLTEVYVDADKPEVDIVVVNTYLAKARGDYREKTDDVSLNVYAIDNKGTPTAPVYAKVRTTAEDVEAIRVLGEDFAIVKDVKENDLYLVTVAAGVVQSMKAPEVVAESTISAFKKTSYVVADGTQYDYATTAEYDWEVLDQYTSINGVENLKDRRYNVILDKYGYLIGLELLEDAKNYAFVAGIDASKSNLTNKTADVNLIHLDGSNEVVRVDLSKSKNSAGNGFLDGREQDDGDYAVLNTWVTYTVNNNGVYTLNEVAAKIDTAKKVKAAQFASEDQTTPNGKTTAYTINKKNNSLPGGDATYAKVYGNNDSVYLTAKLDAVRYNTSLSKYAIVVSEANNVVTGIDNVDMTTYTQSEVSTLNSKFSALTGKDAFSSGVYTLYNDKGYIIAAMVIGKDNGANSNLVYVHTSDVEYEEYKAPAARANEGDWTWVRKVIYQGEEFSLTEAGDNLQYISAHANHGDMQKGNWYKVRFNANNEVIGADDVFAGKSDLLAVGEKIPGAGEYVTVPTDLPASYREYNTVVFQYHYLDNSLGGYPRPHLEGQTLFVTNGTETGVRVASDVKTVLFQVTNNKSFTYYYDTDADLKKVIDDLNKKENLDHDFILNLVVLEGAVRYAVIRDLHEDTFTPGTGTAIGGVTVTFNASNQATVKYVYDTSKPNNGQPTQDQAEAAIMAQLVKDGYTIKRISDSGNDTVFTVTKTNGGFEREYTFTWDHRAVGGAFASTTVVKVNGKDISVNTADVASGKKLADLATAAGLTGDKVGVYATYDNGTTFVPVATTLITAAGGKNVEFGYFKVSVTQAIGGSDTTNLNSKTAEAYLNVAADKLVNGEYFVKAGAIDVPVYVTITGATANDGLKLTVVTKGTITDGAVLKAAGAITASDPHDVTVTLQKSDFSAGDVAITINQSDYTEDITFRVNGHSVTVPKGTNAWNTVKAKLTSVLTVDDLRGNLVDLTDKSVTPMTVSDGQTLTGNFQNDHDYETGWVKLGTNTTIGGTKTGFSATMGGHTVFNNAPYAKIGSGVTVTVESDLAGVTVAGATDPTVVLSGTNIGDTVSTTIADNWTADGKRGSDTNARPLVKPTEVNITKSSDGKTVTLVSDEDDVFVNIKITYTITVGADAISGIEVGVTNS